MIVRPAKTSDYPQHAEIDVHCFEHPWELDDFGRADREVISAVEENDTSVFGYCAYSTWVEGFVVVRVGVRPNWRRRGIGRKMMESLAHMARLRTYAKLGMTVPEENLAAQLWAKACDFKCTKTYEIEGGIGYMFLRQVLGEVP